MEVVCLKPVYLQSCHSLDMNGSPLFVNATLGVPSRANISVRQLITALGVVEDMWKRNRYLER